VVLKELIDACEEVGIAPAIGVEVADDKIVILDNGPGLPPETIDGLIDYTVRVSSREACVSPTRGVQGNALKTILAMAFALDGESWETVIEARGVAHRVTFSDRPNPARTQGHPRPGSLAGKDRHPDHRSVAGISLLNSRMLGRDFLQIADDFTRLNPHLTLSVDWDRPVEAAIHRLVLGDDDGEPRTEWSITASDPRWTKWRPQDPTSPRWYDLARLERLMAAYGSRFWPGDDRRPQLSGLDQHSVVSRSRFP
jgi:hypothetical protein